MPQSSDTLGLRTTSMLIRNKKRHLCPVCGFLLKYPAADFNICPSCGVEFGTDDRNYSIQELQQAWIGRGMPWSSPVSPKPEHFRPLEQLENLEAPAANETSNVTDIVTPPFRGKIVEHSSSTGSVATVRLCFA